MKQMILNTIKFVQNNKTIRAIKRTSQRGTYYDATSDVPKGYQAKSAPKFISDGNIHIIKITPIRTKINVPHYETKLKPLPRSDAKNNFIPEETVVNNQNQANQTAININQKIRPQPSEVGQENTHRTTRKATQPRTNQVQKQPDKTVKKGLHHTKTNPYQTSAMQRYRKYKQNAQAHQKPQPHYKKVKHLRDIPYNQTKIYKRMIVTNRSTDSSRRYIYTPRSCKVYKSLKKAVKGHWGHKYRILKSKVLRVYKINHYLTIDEIQMDNQKRFVSANQVKNLYMTIPQFVNKRHGLIRHINCKIIRNTRTYTGASIDNQRPFRILRAGQVIRAINIKRSYHLKYPITDLVLANGILVPAKFTTLQLI